MYMTRKTVTYDIIDDLNGEQSFPRAEVDALFMTQTNLADGNCLFYSVLQSLSPKMSKAHLLDNAAKLRQRVCDFYATFDATQTYPSDSLEEKIAFLVQLDNGHTSDICVDQEYAEMPDIFVLAHVLPLKIVLFHLVSESRYHVSVISNHLPKRTVYLRYNGVDHYEAFVKAMRSPKAARGSRFTRTANQAISQLLRWRPTKGGKTRKIRDKKGYRTKQVRF